MNEQSLKDRIHLIAREKNIHFNACWKQLLLERFLMRLSKSVYSDALIFKGGFLLSYLTKIGRETTDLDFLLTNIRAEEKEFQEIIEQIVSVYSSDGFVFTFDSIELLTQPHMNYPGYRITLKAAFERMKDKIQVDLGIGDIVQPQTREIPLVKYRGKPIFENSVSLLVYPIESIFSEKLETAISKGQNNSRMKDYHDLTLLIRNKEMMASEKLKESIIQTFFNRGTDVRMLEFDQKSIEVLQQLWAGHLRGLGDIALDFDLPKNFSEIVEEVNKYLSVVLSAPNSKK